jgi:hypothetical protein
MHPDAAKLPEDIRDAAAFAAASQNFRRIMGHEHLWMLRAALDETSCD